MTLQAEIVVGLDEHFPINRTVRLMACSAAFAQRFVLEHYRLCLFAMALRTRLIQTGHRQAARRFHDVMTMRIVALHAIHPKLGHRMVGGQIELGVNFEVTLVAALRVLARVHDESSATASHLHMFAAGTVARFAAGHFRPFQIFLVIAPMRTGGKDARDIGVAISADLIADEGGSFNFRWRDDRAINRRARTEKQTCEPKRSQHHCRADTPIIHPP